MLTVAITGHTRRVLWGRSGGVCAKCRGPLIESATDHDREALVGQECHIVSAAPNGPRHEPASPDGYDALNNLLLLCSVCHDIIDAQHESFPATALRSMKSQHERWVIERTKAGKLPSLRFTPIPEALALSLVTSGRQLVELLHGADDLVVDHDQPRSDDDAEIIAKLFDRLAEADLEMHAAGPGESVRVAQEFQVLLAEDLLRLGVALYGAVAERQVLVDGLATPWRSCVVAARYVPHSEAFGRKPEQAAHPTLGRELQALLRKGHRIVDSARISMDGASAVIELWEQEVVAALEEAGRSDLLTCLPGLRRAMRLTLPGRS